MVKNIGKYEFVESGSLVFHTGENITIRVLNLNFELVFVEDKSVNQTKVDASGGRDNLTLTFTNYNSGMGHVNTVPLPVAIVGGRKLYLNYAVYGFGTPVSLAKAIHYTFMLG